MNYPRYPEYKPSGVEWLGEVPVHWELKRLKFAAACINDKQDTLPEGLEYVAMEHIESWTGKRLETENGGTPESQTNRFRSGDVLFGKLRPYLAKAWLADRDGVCSAELLVLRERDLKPAYLRYWTLMRSFVEVVDGSTYGSKMPRASWDFIGNVLSLIPERDEQRAIAAFLDRETVLIDALIAKKQRLIELLAEKRTALISQAVTKGLNPDAPMKDSGVEWLGEIPAHWDVKRLKNCLAFLNSRRIPLSAEERGGMERNFPYYGASGIIDSVEDFIFDEDTILVAEDGANLLSRSTPLAFVAHGKYWVNNHAHILRPLAGEFGFWEGVLTTYDYTPHITGSAQPKLTKDNLGSIYLPRPPEDEQHAIAKFVEIEGKKMNALGAQVESAIERLKEYRTALIADAVTGKIDVRGLVKEREVA